MQQEVTIKSQPTCKGTACPTVERDAAKVTNEADCIERLEAELCHVHTHHLLARCSALPLLHDLARLF